MKTILKWVIMVIIVAVLVFGAFQIYSTKEEALRQSAILNGLQQSQSELSSKVQDIENKLPNAEDTSQILKRIQDIEDKLPTAEDTKQILKEVLNNGESSIPYLSNGLVWMQGGGERGFGEYQLAAPAYAEELDGDKVLIVEYQGGEDVLIIDKDTHRIIWQFGERGVGGKGNRLSIPARAHRLPNGDIIIADYGNDRVLIVDYNTKAIKWEMGGLEWAADAIYWDEQSIMIACKAAVKQIRLSDKSTLWTYDDWDSNWFNAATLQKLETDGNHVPIQSYGGELLIGYEWVGMVREIRMSDKAVVWQFGGLEKSDFVTGGEAYQEYGSMYTVRWGGGQMVGDVNPTLTLIASDYTSKVYAVTRNKMTVWEIGGNSGTGRFNPNLDTLPLFQPTGVTVTSKGNILIADWGNNSVYEIVPWLMPKRQELETRMFSGIITDGWMDSRTIEVHQYTKKNIMVVNTDKDNAIDWRILGSPDGNRWIEIKSSATLGAGESTYYVTDAPWAFMKAQVKSGSLEAPATVDIFAHCQR